MRVLVIGVGNPLMSDDGVGQRLLEALAARLPALDDVEYLDAGTLGFLLLPRIEQADALLVLDAAQTTVLLALRNPFDAGVLPEVDAAVVTFGGAEPQLDAAVGALLGDFIPTGVSPVELGT